MTSASANGSAAAKLIATHASSRREHRPRIEDAATHHRPQIEERHRADRPAGGGNPADVRDRVERHRQLQECREAGRALRMRCGNRSAGRDKHRCENEVREPIAVIGLRKHHRAIQVQGADQEHRDRNAAHEQQATKRSVARRVDGASLGHPYSGSSAPTPRNLTESFAEAGASPTRAAARDAAIAKPAPDQAQKRIPTAGNSAMHSGTPVRGSERAEGARNAIGQRNDLGV